MEEWDEFFAALNKLKMAEGSNFNIGSFPSPMETVLSKSQEEAIRRGNFDSIMRGQSIQVKTDEISKVEEELINDFAEDLIDKLL